MPVTTSDLRTLSASNFPDNVSGEISPADLRSAMTLIADIVDALLGGAAKTYPSRQAAVDAGPAASGRIVTIEDGTLVVRESSRTADDPLFATAPRWGVLFRTPTTSFVTQAIASLQTEVGDSLAVALSDVAQAILMSETELGQQMADLTAHLSIGGALDRGDSAVLVTINGVPVAGFDESGRLVATAAPSLIDSMFAGASPAQADVLARASAYVQGLILDTALERGDVAELARLNGVAVLTILPSGHADLRLSDDAVADVRARLDLDTLVALSAPLAADLAGDYDAWDVWQRGDLTYFTGNLWGDQPRGYVRRGAGLPWAVAPSVMLLRLVTGDHVANALPSTAPDRWAHIATLGDGADQDGLDGAVPSGPAADLARAGAGFAALSADRGLAARTGALARYGVRSEAVEGATLAQLATGQPLANLIRARSEFGRLAGLYGGQAAVESVTVLHSGGAATATAYRDQLVALAGTLVEETGAGQVNVIPPGGTWASGDDPAILGAVEALRTRGATPLVLASPVHWCGIRTGTLATPDAPSMTMLAELDALATAAGTGWHGPIPFQASRDQQDGIFVWVDCEVMDGATLVVPTYGVRYSGATIANMTVIADPVTGRMTRLQIRLTTGAPGVLSIAHGATGTDQSRFANRCDLRDSWGAPSITGQTLRRYTHSARFEVT